MNAAYALIRLATAPWIATRRHRRADYSPERVHKIWVHKPDHLGDAILARPALAALRAAFPNAALTIGCHPEAAALFEGDPLDIATYGFDSPFLGGQGRLRAYRRQVRAFGPDLVVNLRHDVRDILLCGWLGARWLVSYDHRDAARFASHPGSPPLENRSEAENHVTLLRETLHIDAADPPPPVFAAASPPAWDELPGDGPRIVLHAVARTAAKMWPVASWRELITMLGDKRPTRLALIGSASDREPNAAIAAGLPVADWAGRFSLRETAELIAAADALVGIDSGPGHLAAAVGTPVISLMSGTNRAARWAPATSTALSHAVDCAPCACERCPVVGHPCMREIAPAKVLAALEEVLVRHADTL
ncbi:MAG: glycosyltransferase family 9 protein [Candidatus Lernaella stagnicola]|nr:glycosyltransferase family 9 protein [Candidatus Lernaella stagnicola]